MIWLFVAFVVLPVLEIYLITQVAGQIGWPLAIVLVIAISAAGAWLVRREGLGVIGRVRDSIRAGRMPADDLADGAMIFFASALMLTPGFLTDALGLAFLIPPIRAVLRPPVIAFFRRRIDLRVANALEESEPSGPDRPTLVTADRIVDRDVATCWTSTRSTTTSLKEIGRLRREARITPRAGDPPGHRPPPLRR